jgi:DNA-binding MarR family transcriptional regulator
MTEHVLLPKALRSWMDISTHFSMRGWSHHAKATGLSMPQFSILMQLFYRGNCGISELSERFEISNAAASQHVDNLVQAGLLARAEDPRDRRAKQIQLSPKGRALVESGMNERYRWMDMLVETLEEKDHQKVTEALVILTQAARKLAEVQVQVQ